MSRSCSIAAASPAPWAFTQAQVWRHAEPGVVEVTAVPQIDVDPLPDGAITAAVINEHRVEALRQRAADALDKRRPLGVRAIVSWARVRPVSVAARVVVGPEGRSGDSRARHQAPHQRTLLGRCAICRSAAS